MIVPLERALPCVGIAFGALCLNVRRYGLPGPPQRHRKHTLPNNNTMTDYMNKQTVKPCRFSRKSDIASSHISTPKPASACVKNFVHQYMRSNPTFFGGAPNSSLMLRKSFQRKTCCFETTFFPRKMPPQKTAFPRCPLPQHVTSAPGTRTPRILLISSCLSCRCTTRFYLHACDHTPCSAMALACTFRSHCLPANVIIIPLQNLGPIATRFQQQRKQTHTHKANEQTNRPTKQTTQHTNQTKPKSSPSQTKSSQTKPKHSNYRPTHGPTHTHTEPRKPAKLGQGAVSSTVRFRE